MLRLVDFFSDFLFLNFSISYSFSLYIFLVNEHNCSDGVSLLYILSTNNYC